MQDRKLTAVVYFLDETFEELEYDITTTVVEAVEQLAGLIKLQNFATFTLYESRKVGVHQKKKVFAMHYRACKTTLLQSLLKGAH